jgi:hypothetical protein
MRDKKATRYGNVPGDLLKLLGEDDLKIMTQLFSNIHETGEWPKDLIEVTVISLKKKPRATKCNSHCTHSKNNSEGT